MNDLLNRVKVKNIMIPDYNQELLLNEYVSVCIGDSSDVLLGRTHYDGAKAVIGKLIDPMSVIDGDVKFPNVIRVYPSEEGDSWQMDVNVNLDGNRAIPSGCTLLVNNLWKYIPYNIPVKGSEATEIYKIINGMGNIHRQDGSIDINAVDNILANSSNFNKIKENYIRIVNTGKRNHHSMVLFSGHKFDSTKSYSRPFDNCLYMGDFEASKENVENMREIHRSFCSQSINVIQVPPHGSIHNFSADAGLYDSGVLAITLASASSKRHPDPEIIKNILDHGGMSAKVSQSEYTKQEFEITI